MESIGKEDEDGLPYGLNSKNKSSNNNNQESYSNNRTEKATNMEANMVPSSVRIAGLQNHVERFYTIGVAESKHAEELENVKKTLER